MKDRQDEEAVDERGEANSELKKATEGLETLRDTFSTN